jgi:RND superfamily putative drug exporter
MHAFLGRLGRLATRRHWIIIAGWIVILGVLLGLRGAYGGTFINNYTVPGSQSDDGQNLLKAEFPSQSGYAGQIVFRAKKGTVADQENAVNESMSNVGKLPHVVAATSPFSIPNSPQVSKGGTIAYGTASWSVQPASLDQAYLDRLDKAVAPARSAGLQVEYGAGAGQIANKTNDLRSELIGLACALVLLVFMFASIAAALIPLLSAICSVLAGLSLVGLLAATSTFPTSAPTVATLLGLGVAIDYGLFLVARHRENVDRGMSISDSVSNATSTSGTAVVVAGTTVVVAILGLYVAEVPFVGAMGAASAIVVAVAMLAALTLTPAFMGVVGQNIRAIGAIRRRQEAAGQVEHEHSAFARWGKMVSSRPLPWGIASLAILVVLAIPFFFLRLGQIDAGTNPTSDSIRRAYDLIQTGFGPGANSPITTVVQLPNQSAQDNQTLLANAQKTLAEPSDVASASPAQTNSAGTVAVLTVTPKTAQSDKATTALVNELRNDQLPKIPAKTYLTGSTAGGVDFTAKISNRMPWLILAVIAVAFLLLTAAFQSIVIAAKAAILNLISVGAAYGVIVAVFEWGWGSSIIGIHQHLPIPAFVPMLMFAIVFGLSMDYEVFLISRVHEAWVRTGDAHRSVAIGIGSTARVITTAAAIMVTVFLSFVLASDPTVKMFAVGMAAAVLIDASIIRMILVPAIMSLLGPRAWYLPGWLKRITPHIDIEGGAPQPEPVADQPVPAPIAPEKPPATPTR